MILNISSKTCGRYELALIPGNAVTCKTLLGLIAGVLMMLMAVEDRPEPLILFAIATSCLPNQDSDVAFIKRLARDPCDQKLWREFINRFHHRIVDFIRSRLHRNKSNRHTEPEDLAQEVYIKLIKDNFGGLRGFKGETDKSFYCYLHTIAANLVLNLHRANMTKKRRRSEVSLDKNPESRAGRSVQQAMYRANESEHRDFNIESIELRQQIDHVLDQILEGSKRNRDKLIFKLHYLSGMSAKEIASIPAIEMTAAAVSMVLYRIRQKLSALGSEFCRN